MNHFFVCARVPPPCPTIYYLSARGENNVNAAGRQLFRDLWGFICGIENVARKVSSVKSDLCHFVGLIYE